MFVKRCQKSKKLPFIILPIIGICIISSSYISYLLYPQINKKLKILKTWQNQIEKLPLHLSHYINNYRAKPEMLKIHISKTNFYKLKYDRRRVLVNKKKFRYVPAKAEYLVNKTNEIKSKNLIPIKIRLKDNRNIYVKDNNRWSFRVEVRGNNTLSRMKRFSLQKPDTINYVYEWLFHQFLEKEGVLNLRYKFIRLVLNNNDLGIYTLEEHFSQNQVGNIKYQRGPIIRFNENYGGAIGVSIAPIEPSTPEKRRNKSSLPILQRSINLLDSFRQRKMRISQVFDAQKLATFFALTDLTGTHHAARWNSMRFYYNPITSKLEPIGFEAHHRKPDKEPSLTAELALDSQRRIYYRIYRTWFNLFFNDAKTFDQEFYDHYILALERVSKKSYIDNFFSNIDLELERNLSLNYKDAPLLTGHNFNTELDLFEATKDQFYQRAKYIRGELDHPDNKYLLAYYKASSPNEISLNISNISTKPIDILYLSYLNKSTNKAKRIKPTKRAFLIQEKLHTVQNKTRNVPLVKEFKFKIDSSHNWIEENKFNLKIHFKVAGQNQVRRREVYPWVRLEKHFVHLLNQKTN